MRLAYPSGCCPWRCLSPLYIGRAAPAAGCLRWVYAPMDRNPAGARWGAPCWAENRLVKTSLRPLMACDRTVGTRACWAIPMAREIVRTAQKYGPAAAAATPLEIG